MALVDLTLASLGDLDHGTVRVMVDKAIADAVRDLDDRGEEDGKERTVSIRLALKKQRGGLITCQVHCEARVPPRLSNQTVAEVQQKSGEVKLRFQDLSPENPNQSTFEEMDKS